MEEVFLGLLRPGAVVYDLGANIGWYSLLAARKVGPSGKVFAFEPSLRNAALIERNALTNRLPNIFVIPAAVTDRAGWMTFLDRGSLMGRLDKDDSETQAQRRAGRRGKTRRETIVPITTLDAWLQATGQPPPDLVKIDVEGAELGVLRGMTQTLGAASPDLIVELHGTGAEVTALLDSVGYEHRAAGQDRAGPDAVLTHLLARAKPAR